ncbi:head maturation protease, ClpP-related [Scatolibacter rhodanostii]|uniref:head maturation protease, ClpP-related n=1 Tax=Scatolibacter rhodanostii TaxID=2014781 RepID=UPI000C084F0C|nr:head maturation protease, ClpP-related [Scatolibacter rhodanostii]
MHKFWNFDDFGGERVLYLEGAISDETWWGDEVTPQIFKQDLYAGTGDVTVSINSPGGDVFAAAAIYTMLKEYPGKITVKISALAASAASVVAMAGDTILMSPVAMMIHNPSTIAIGDSDEMLRAKNMLDEVKESIINAYATKTNLSRSKISDMMDSESWMDMNKAIKLGFADGILENVSPVTQNHSDGMVFSRKAVSASFISKFLTANAKPPKPGTPYEHLESRIDLIKFRN